MIFEGKNIDINGLNAWLKGTLSETLGMEVTEIGSNHLTMSMPVDHRTVQPTGILNGGASMALAESVASMAGNILVGPEKACVGLEINGNHLKAVKSGLVFGKAIPIHLGGKSQVWSIEIRNELGQMVCISRMTLMVIDLK